MSDGYRLEIELVGLPTPERNARRHWRVESKEIQAWRRAVGFAVLGREPEAPLKRARVTFVRHSAREPDPRNLDESFKSIEDALVSAGILENDKSENFIGGKPVILWEKAPPKEGFVTITVEESNDDRTQDERPGGSEEAKDSGEAAAGAHATRPGLEEEGGAL